MLLYDDGLGERAYSLYDVEQFIREAGAERVTEDAVINLEKELERLTERIAGKALRYAQHAGRKKLIRKSDILLLRNNYSRPCTFKRTARMTNAASIRER